MDGTGETVGLDELVDSGARDLQLPCGLYGRKIFGGFHAAIVPHEQIKAMLDRRTQLIIAAIVAAGLVANMLVVWLAGR